MMIQCRIIITMAFCLIATSSQAVSPGQLDDFNSGSLQDWRIGLSSPNTPVHDDTCGTGVPASGCMQLTSGPTAQPKLAVFNSVQWAGDYSQSNILGIRMQVRNTGSVSVSLRLGYRTPQGSKPAGASEDVLTVPPGPDYVEGFFRVTPGSTISISGADTTEILANTNRLFITHYPDAPSQFWGPPDIDATVDIDDIELVTTVDLVFANGFETTDVVE